MGKASTKAAWWTIRKPKQLERGQFLRRQNWSEEENTWREQELGVEREKDIGEKRTRDCARRDVNVGGRKALFNSKPPSHATTPLKEGKGKSLPNPACRIRLPVVLFLLGARSMYGLTETWYPALLPSHSAVVSDTREKNM
jgi:hypothetical protein